MVWFLLGVALLSLAAGLWLGLYLRMKRSGARIAEELRNANGSDLKLVTGCGVVAGANRVPGVLALLRDRVVVRPLAFLKEGEVPLHRVVRFHSEEARTSRYGRARKYRKAHVLALRTDTGEENVFVVKQGDARRWEEALAGAGLRPSRD